ncbi:MAG: adenylate/guanylate cyclase domain-containing protein, partial [Pseudomonadota bacterium]
NLAADEMINLANAYFDVIVKAVEDHGGEILKFIGDGVLAIFPVNDDVSDRNACQNALQAAHAALAAQTVIETASDLDDPKKEDGRATDVSFGIGLHFGQVLYGNVGSSARLDFTVLGRAINLAARIESLCASLERTVLISASINDRLDEPGTLITEQRLKGFDNPVAIFAPPASQTAPTL